MKKKEFFSLILFAFVFVYFVANNGDFFKRKSYGGEKFAIDKTMPLFIRALQKGDSVSLKKVYLRINKIDRPLTLFNLTMSPVVWNDAALNYRGDYKVVKTIEIYGKPIGYLGEGNRIIKKEKSNAQATLWVLLIVLFFIVSFSDLNFLQIFYLFGLIFIFAYTKAFIPIVLFFSLLYVKFGRRKIPEYLASGVFFLFAGIGCFLLLESPFVFYDIYSFFGNPNFIQYFFSLILSATFFLMLKPGKVAIFLLFMSLFLGFPVFIFLAVIFFVSFIKGKSISSLLLKILVFSILFAGLGHFFSYLNLKKFVKSQDFSYSYFQKTGLEKLNRYLKLASTRGFADLRDFVLRSGLENEDFFAAYFNVLGEAVEKYSNNLPEIMEFSKEAKFFDIEYGGKTRSVVSGSGRFKVGFISIAIASDIYSHPFLKKHKEIREFLSIKRGKKGFDVKVKEQDLFFVVSDVSLIFVLSIMFFLTYYSSEKKKGLFERVIFSVYFGFSIILVILGLFLFLHSSRIAKGLVKKTITKDLEKVKILVEKQPENLSHDYLMWLKDVFKVDIGLYGNGILQYSTDDVNLTILMPFIPFNILKSEGRGIFFFKNIAYQRLNIVDIPYAVLCVKGDNNFKPLYEFLRIAAFIFLFVFIVSYFVSYAITEKLVNPLFELSAKAKAVVKGDFDFEIDYHEDDEISDLIDAISFMANSLKENYARLKTVIDNVSSGIVLLDRDGKVVVSNKVFNSLDEELKDKALKGKNLKDFEYKGRHFQVYSKQVDKGLRMIVIEDLTEVVKASKLEIITDMARKIAHDIKNPLTPIKLNIDYLLSVWKKDSDKLDKVLPDVAENISLKVEELKRIASQFSGVFKAYRDTKIEDIDLVEFLNILFSSYAGLKYEINGDNAKIKANPLKLARIFENLVENTISFSEKPFIKVEISDEGDFVKIVYKDNGKGIDEDLLEKIFEPYFSTREEGTGLGLFIVREFVEEMGGKIKAVPSREGGCFELRFRKSDS